MGTRGEEAEPQMNSADSQRPTSPAGLGQASSRGTSVCCSSLIRGIRVSNRNREAWEWLRSQPFPSGVIGTKIDKLTRAERTRHARKLQSVFDIAVPLVSAETGEGLEELWKLIAKLPRQTAA